MSGNSAVGEGRDFSAKRGGGNRGYLLSSAKYQGQARAP